MSTVQGKLIVDPRHTYFDPDTMTIHDEKDMKLIFGPLYAYLDQDMMPRTFDSGSVIIGTTSEEVSDLTVENKCEKQFSDIQNPIPSDPIDIKDREITSSQSNPNKSTNCFLKCFCCCRPKN